ncbi:hypothetical protein THIOKS1910006 [Thiocapsa sp. KS1]|nr:hypothetical protein THIOKS1910006 [Thiocapsa sp. KS1]
MTENHLHLFQEPDHASIDEIRELELSDADIIDAMREIPGYIDITTTDFRTIYHLAHAHAVERMNSRMCARNLMRSPIQPLHPTTPLYQAAGLFVRQGVKALPVVVGGGLVTGILTETDILKRLGADSFFGAASAIARTVRHTLQMLSRDSDEHDDDITGGDGDRACRIYADHVRLQESRGAQHAGRRRPWSSCRPPDAQGLSRRLPARSPIGRVRTVCRAVRPP